MEAPPTQPSHHRKERVNALEGKGAAPTLDVHSTGQAWGRVHSRDPGRRSFFTPTPYQNSESVNTEVSLSILESSNNGKEVPRFLSPLKLLERASQRGTPGSR